MRSSEMRSRAAARLAALAILISAVGGGTGPPGVGMRSIRGKDPCVAAHHELFQSQGYANWQRGLGGLAWLRAHPQPLQGHKGRRVCLAMQPGQSSVFTFRPEPARFGGQGTTVLRRLETHPPPGARGMSMEAAGGGGERRHGAGWLGRQGNDGCRGEERSSGARSSRGGAGRGGGGGARPRATLPELASFSNLEALLQALEPYVAGGSVAAEDLAPAQAVAAMHHLKRLGGAGGLAGRRRRVGPSLERRAEACMDAFARVVEQGMWRLTTKHVAIALAAAGSSAGLPAARRSTRFEGLFREGGRRVLELATVPPSAPRALRASYARPVRAPAARALLGVDETCPISTEGWTRRVHFRPGARRAWWWWLHAAG